LSSPLEANVSHSHNAILCTYHAKAAGAVRRRATRFALWLYEAFEKIGLPHVRYRLPDEMIDDIAARYQQDNDFLAKEFLGREILFPDFVSASSSKTEVIPDDDRMLYRVALFLAEQWEAQQLLHKKRG